MISAFGWAALTLLSAYLMLFFFRQCHGGASGRSAGLAVLVGETARLLCRARLSGWLALFDASECGQRLGWLKTPARLLQAAAPLIFGTALSVWGLGALYVTAGIGALATRALQAIKRA